MLNRNPELKKVAVLGAECTGKTTLARSLALRFQTVWVPENAREYVSTAPPDYKVEDIERMAKEQLDQEMRLGKSANHFIFVDTELITARVWCVDVFGKCPHWIDEGIKNHRYDLYLLTSND